MIELVKAYASGSSASDRDFVERVREHILPLEPYTFETVHGREITVGGPDLVPLYFETLEAHRLARGSTYIPQLVDHAGESFGALAKYELADDGIWAVFDLWAEGVEARKGRDFCSANWTFSDFGEDGRPRCATAHEVSLTAEPQFQFNQSPIEALESGSFRVAASFTAPHLPSPEGTMTPEEMIAILLGSEEFKAAIGEMIAEAIPTPEPVEAMEEDAGEEEEAEASVAASIVPLLSALNDKIDRVEEAQKVAASLRGKRTDSISVGGPSPGADFISSRLSAGVSLTDALAENRALTKGA